VTEPGETSATEREVARTPFDPTMAWFVMPAYNEGPVIAAVVGGVLAADARLVVIDDHSSDETGAAALAAGAAVIRHPVNLGQGAALQTGIDYALARGAELLVTFDADGQHRVEDALRLAEAVHAGRADIACGSRFLGVEAPGMPRSRRLVLRAATIVTRLSTGVPVTDAHNGLRAMNRTAARTLRITHNRMAHASEIVAQIGQRRLRYLELPVEILYTPYSLSKGQRISNSLNIVGDLLLGWLR